MKKKVRRAVLAYSGGLDTSIIVPWLKQTYGCEVVCYCSDVGQGAELEGLEARARKSGASDVVVEDLRLPFVRDFCFPALRAGAVYEGAYLLGTSLARPLIAARQVACALEAGADAVAHGCTGKGNDQVRFELAYLALAPQLTVIAPWREWDIVSREDALAYAERNGIPVPTKKGDLFSRDANLWHISHEGGPLEDPASPAPETLYKLTAFERGVPVALEGRKLGPVELVQELNAIAGRHGVGRADLVESRLIGMKSRGVYETPAGTVLHAALEDLCRLVLPHDLLRTRAELSTRMADLIYNGQWFSPLRLALQAFVEAALEHADGDVTVELFRGQARAVARTSPKTLHRPDLASFDMTGYDAGHAEGFIRLFGLPLATAARREAENGAKKDGPAKNATRRSSKAALRGEERSDALEARGGRRRSALRGARRSQDGGAERAARSSSPLKAAPGVKTHVR
ncbi:MAG: argininosuccinate synthase [Candidatus Eisenbacteria bacterium]|uniref:Argininosuccinate synthase n=1 Tax=Eiseniibacteriota bacterium TaxID=2212470 RepID=A0A538SCW5_UNCEI|nr:MAG: argininosuccinate synthase [Candidatus Eisenbacteria bacterium]